MTPERIMELRSVAKNARKSYVVSRDCLGRAITECLDEIERLEKQTRARVIAAMNRDGELIRP